MRLPPPTLMLTPSPQPADMEEKEQNEHTAVFTRAMASFEAIDSFYQTRFASKEDKPSGAN